MFRPADDNGSLLCWETPLYLEMIESQVETNRALAELIIRDAQTIQGSVNSNADAWQSPDDMFVRYADYVQPLFSAISQASRRLTRLVGGAELDFAQTTAEAWATVNGPGHHHDVHIHHGCMWSGAYYVKVPKMNAPGEGAIEFLDPRPSARWMHDRAIQTVTPKEGMLIMFPSWLQHWVRPHFQHELRVSIAFNVRSAT